jgi:hypothetical protein
VGDLNKMNGSPSESLDSRWWNLKKNTTFATSVGVFLLLYREERRLVRDAFWDTGAPCVIWSRARGNLPSQQEAPFYAFSEELTRYGD